MKNEKSHGGLESEPGASPEKIPSPFSGIDTEGRVCFTPVLIFPVMLGNGVPQGQE